MCIFDVNVTYVKICFVVVIDAGCMAFNSTCLHRIYFCSLL